VAQEAQQRELIGGRYRLVKALHTGGFGRVWQARDLRLDGDVAVKEVWLPPSISAEERTERLARAEREARNAAALRNHPNIVTVRDVVMESGVPWIVMQLVTGHSLAEDIAASGPLSSAQASYVADSLLKALGAAHAAGIVHRDVKPANVMFADNGEVLLTDFGIAVHETDTALTATGMIVGSMDYIAPERIRGEDGKAAADMFSLGVTLYQAVTGVCPFHRDSVAASLAAILFDQPTPPPCPTGLSTLIMRLLAKDPAQRPTVPAARALLATLATTGAAPQVRLPAPPPRVPAPKRLAPTRVAPVQLELPKRPRLRIQRVPPRHPIRRPMPPRRSMPRPAALRTRRRHSGVPVLVVIGLLALGAFATWDRGAGSATAGDCVYHRQVWHIEPCSLPWPWRDGGNYQVLARVDGTSAECPAVPGWVTGDSAVVLPGRLPVTLCLAPLP
jgi:serine/threonine protein kinase